VELTQALNRDLDGGFPPLIDAYQDRLYRFALRLTANPHDAEEIAQEAFVRAYRWLRDHRPLPADFQPQPWLYRVALNVSRNRVRRPGPPTAGLEHAAELAAGDGMSPSAQAERDETRAELAGLLASLPLHYREAVVLRYVEELSYAEIGSVLARPEGTVKSDVHRGLGMLRTAMAGRREEILV
jgi:RNA polymerase sigma-70 factor (ECF subfamily)